jgi:hypothetical protein
MEIMVDKVTKEQVPFFEVFGTFASNHHPIKAPYASVINLTSIGWEQHQGIRSHHSYHFQHHVLSQ